MDRLFFYPGELPAAEDLLAIQRETLKEIARLSQAITGGGSVVDGVDCQATQPNTLSVLLTPGTCFWPTVVDGSPFGLLPPDLSGAMKQGSYAGETLPLSPPTGAGTDIVYLIQATYTEPDINPSVLAYYNAANPAQPFSGPGNSGGQQYKNRVGRCAISAKAGAPASTGTATAPAADPGYLPLWFITVPHGAVTITQSMISAAPNAPRFKSRLTNDVSGFALQSSLNNTNTALSGINTYVSNTVRFSNEITYYGSNTFVVPPACYALRVRVAGGGGGGGSQLNSIPGGGGGAGGYAEGYYLVTPGQVIPITIGAGGSGGRTGSNGGPGGSTSFGALIAATGGVGGEGGSGGNPAGGAGGNGVGGQFLIIGGSGFDGVTGTSLKGGDGGSSAFGGGGRASTGAAAVQQGQAVGSGGGAGYANENAPGGSGQGGAVIIEF